MKHRNNRAFEKKRKQEKECYPWKEVLKKIERFERIW